MIEFSVILLIVNFSTSAVDSKSEPIYMVCDISANYFIDCISEQDLDEMNIEIIRNTLYKVRSMKYC